MISVFLTKNPVVRDALAGALSLEKKESSTISVYRESKLSENFTRSEKEDTSSFSFTPFVYQKGKWVLVFSSELSLSELSKVAGENYAPDFIYLPYFGNSIDVVHEIGDVILPNTFLTYDSRIAESEIDENNRDDFSGDAKFLESYTLQKDYFVEDYGLSVGGIVVAETPSSLLVDTPEKLMTAYEADIYVGDSLSEAYELAKD